MDDSSSVRIEFVDPDADSGSGGGSGRGGGKTVDMLLSEVAERAPSRLAYADPPNRSAFGLGAARRVSFAEAEDKANLIAARLVATGLLPGDRIAIRLPNMIELPLILAGAWRAGLVPVCLPLMWRMDELHQTLPQIDPAAIVTVGRLGDINHSEMMCEAAAHHIAVRHIFGIGGDLADGVSAIDDWFSAGTQEATLDGGEEPVDLCDRPAAMTWATGKRGTYPVPRTHRELLALGQMAAVELGLSGDDVVLTTYPMTSITSLAGQMIAALHAGATLLLHQPFSYDTFVAQLQDLGVTVTAVPDSVLSALQERGDLDEGRTSLRTVARVRPWPHQPPQHDVVDAMPVVDIHNIGELALVIERTPAPAGLPLGRLTRAGDGDETAAPYLETRVRGSMSDGPRRTLTGALLMRGPTVPAGPFECAGAIASDVLRPDAQGFLNSGLHCTVDEESSERFVCARQTSMIYHGGVAIGAEELDAAYASFPDVLDAAAVPIDDPLMGERIFAAVVPSAHSTASLSNLKVFLADKGLADYKCPEQIIVVRSIPRDAEGNVLRTEILNRV